MDKLSPEVIPSCGFGMSSGSFQTSSEINILAQLAVTHKNTTVALRSESTLSKRLDSHSPIQEEG